MTSRKQRRRRQKERRHDYEYVYIDDEGQEVEVDSEEAEPARADRADKARPKPKTKTKPTRSRGMREVPPPSWRRVARRALIFAPFMFITLLLLNRNQSYDQLAINTVVLLAFFLPFSYVLDSFMYRLYVKRSGAGTAKGTRRR